MFPLKIMSWNVEHFNGKDAKTKELTQKRKNRITRVIELIKAHDPDVFAISEVLGRDIYREFCINLPHYNYFITEGQQTQEILTAYRSTLTGYVSQRNEYKLNNPHLRPSSLVTIRDGYKHVPILFTHLKSLPTPEGFGLRDAQFEKMLHLKTSIDKAAPKISEGTSDVGNLIVVGDMNTMGFDYYYSAHDIQAEEEIEVLTKKFKRRGMDRLKKTYQHTWYNGSKSKYDPSDLDHVFAANQLAFKPINNDGDFVHVVGWPEEDTAAKQDKWINDYSDHAALVFTLNGIGS